MDDLSISRSLAGRRMGLPSRMAPRPATAREQLAADRVEHDAEDGPPSMTRPMLTAKNGMPFA